MNEHLKSNLTWEQAFRTDGVATGTIYNPSSAALVSSTPLTYQQGYLTAGSTLTIINSNNMNQQVKVAVFKVTRNDKNEVTSSSFINEYWVERKVGTSIDFAVAKLIGDKYEADEIVIREIFSVTM